MNENALLGAWNFEAYLNKILKTPYPYEINWKIAYADVFCYICQKKETTCDVHKWENFCDNAVGLIEFSEFECCISK